VKVTQPIDAVNGIRLPPITLRLVWLCLLLPVALAAAERPRLIVLTDIGGDPDDQQSLVRLMLYANELELEGLIASSSRGKVNPSLIREIVEAYGEVRDNLSRHAEGYPRASDLLSRIRSGNPSNAIDDLGDGRDTAGSSWIIEVVDRPDPRPVNIAIWGGSMELAQALWRVRQDRGEAGVRKFVAKLRVHAIGHQDETGPWIVESFSDLFYILDKAPEGQDKRESVFRGMYLGGDESLTSLDWLQRNVTRGHGPLGALYPTKTWTAPNPNGALKEGDTPSWLYFLPMGLSDPAHPNWGSWGGRFVSAGQGLWVDAADTVQEKTHPRATVWRWRPDFQNEFAARMDWCVMASSDANHAPRFVAQGERSAGIAVIETEAGFEVELSSEGLLDPDGGRLSYRWFVYPEAGGFHGRLSIEEADSARALLLVPMAAAGKSIHVLLATTDRGDPPLTAYRRFILRVGNVEK